MVRRVRVSHDHLYSIQLHRHEFVVQRIAVQIDSMVGFAVRRSELIHDTTHDSCKLVFCSTTYLSDFCEIIGCA